MVRKHVTIRSNLWKICCVQAHTNSIGTITVLHKTGRFSASFINYLPDNEWVKVEASRYLEENR